MLQGREIGAAQRCCPDPGLSRAWLRWLGRGLRGEGGSAFFGCVPTAEVWDLDCVIPSLFLPCSVTLGPSPTLQHKAESTRLWWWGRVRVFVRCCFIAVQDLCMTDSYHAAAVARKPHEPSTQRPQPNGTSSRVEPPKGSLWCTVPCIVHTKDCGPTDLESRFPELPDGS